jgi:hypothetical protein
VKTLALLARGSCRSLCSGSSSTGLPNRSSTSPCSATVRISAPARRPSRLVGSYWTVIFFQPQYLQNVLDYSVLASGVLVLPITLPMAALSAFSGRLIEYLGARVLMTAGLGLQQDHSRSWARRPAMSISSHASAIRPSRMRRTAVDVNVTLDPVGATPRKGP